MPPSPSVAPGGVAARRRRRRGSRRPARCGRAAVVVVLRLQRDRRRAAKRLEVRDHAEDLLIGEADRRLVDRGHRRRESRHDEGGRFVHRLGEVLDIAQARDAGLRADIDPREVGEPERPGLADRVAGQAESLALHDLAADLDHVGRGQVACQRRSPGRLHFLLRHHLADIGIEPGRREDEGADPDDERDPHDVRLVPSLRRLHLGGPAARNRAGRAGSRSRTRRRSGGRTASTVTETTFVAKPRVGVNASTDWSRMTP